MEEVRQIDEPVVQKQQGDYPNVLHVQCDCSNCTQVEEIPEKLASVLVITRSGGKYVADSVRSHKEMKHPQYWENQRQVRQECLKEIQKCQKVDYGKQELQQQIPDI